MRIFDSAPPLPATVGPATVGFDRSNTPVRQGFGLADGLSPTDRETALAAPGDLFGHPRAVLTHPALRDADKRAILAAWASDAHAVDSAPSLRRLPGGAAVPVDAVLDALAELDAGSDAPTGGRKPAAPRAGTRTRLPFRGAFHLRRRDDDDDPPPCPATAMPRPRPPMPGIAAVAA